MSKSRLLDSKADAEDMRCQFCFVPYPDVASPGLCMSVLMGRLTLSPVLFVYVRSAFPTK